MLYGTAEGPGYGNVFELEPPSTPGGAWTESTLYSFGAQPDGGTPVSLALGPNGVLYGTTAFGGASTHNAGTVFELSPPATPGGAWTESVLYSFTGGHDGSTPNSILAGPAGVLYGTTFGTTYLGPYFGPAGIGSVFELTPPASPCASWTKTILQQFGHGQLFGPDSPLILYNGKLYGASSAPNGGIVFELNPPPAPGGAWTTINLHRFTNSQTPTGAMVLEPDGMLYGVTQVQNSLTPQGTVYRIAAR